MLKLFLRIPDRYIYIIIKTPPEQYSKPTIRIKELSDEIKPLTEDENAIIVFDDILGLSNSSFIDQFFFRGQHNNLDFYYLSQSYVDLSKSNIRNNCNKTVLLYQTLKEVERIYRDVAGYDMCYDDFEDLCRESWEEEYNYLCINRSKNRERGRYIICNESKKKYMECTPETKPF